MMKTLASLLLICATLAGSAAYAREPSGELDYPPAVSQASSLTRAQVLAELQAAKVAGQVSFGEIDKPALPVADSTAPGEPVQAEAMAVHVIGIYPPGDEAYKAAFSVTAASRG